MQKQDFQEVVWAFYHDYGRSMPWRVNHSPYAVVLSEFMLQQTQVPRVIQKFDLFMSSWKNWAELAAASQVDVITAWKGLGYNRRALWLHDLARLVQDEHAGMLPQDRTVLESFRGIGPNTAGAIMTYAFNEPVIFIETNIRRVFIHHFMGDAVDIHDKELMPLIEDCLDTEHPREWYWALMDYGTFLATHMENPNRRSKHHTIQSKFEGSKRQLRGKVLEALIRESQTGAELYTAIPSFHQAEIKGVLQELVREGFLKVADQHYVIGGL